MIVSSKTSFDMITNMCKRLENTCTVIQIPLIDFITVIIFLLGHIQYVNGIEYRTKSNVMHGPKTERLFAESFFQHATNVFLYKLTSMPLKLNKKLSLPFGTVLICSILHPILLQIDKPSCWLSGYFEILIVDWRKYL